MALSGLDIYKLLPKTNCRECGFPTCLAFAMQLAKKAVGLDKCPYISVDAKQLLEASSQPPIRLISIGSGENKVEVGNETVMFRHEEKFHHPAAIGFIIEDGLSDKEIIERIAKINKFKFERVGQLLKVDLIAIKQKTDKKRFIEAVKLISANTDLGIVLISGDLEAQREALEILNGRQPLLLAQNSDIANYAKLAKDYKVPAVVCADNLEDAALKTKELNSQGVIDLVLNFQAKPVAKQIWGLTQARRLALKKSNRALGYPVLTIIERKDTYEEAIEAAVYIAKYAGIVLLSGVESWEILSLLTLRQNIFTDPQKPLQIEPKVYAIGQVSDKSPVLVTTNFSLTYYTVLGEVEASKVPTYIASVDTEGMSVLTAWAAEKFTPDKIIDSIDKFRIKETVAHKRLIIPGYVAVMSGELEDKSGWQVVVGPKEASGLPTFLKNLA